MKKLGGFLAAASAVAAEQAPPADNPLELDEELFTARGVQLGSENEALRNLVLDATAKVEELDGIKNAVTRLVDPVGKALKVIESERADKIALQAVLNNTRTAYGKLRSEAAELEKKAAATENECRGLRQELTTTQSQLKTAETTKAEIAIDIAGRRAQVPPRMPAHPSDEREQGAARGDPTAGRALAGEREARDHARVRAQRRPSAPGDGRGREAGATRFARQSERRGRAAGAQGGETEAALAAVQGRLRHIEADFAEVSIERTRLTGALDEANERHEREITSQRTRYDALQARAQASEKLLGEAREHLLARAEDLREPEPARQRPGERARRLADAARRTRRRAHHAQVGVTELEAEPQRAAPSAPPPCCAPSPPRKAR